MKLASKNSGRDGRLLVVSRDLSRATDATAIAPTMQAALDDWADVEPKLKGLFDRLQTDAIESIPFEPDQCAAPLPRAYQWIDGSAYVNHVELMRRSRDEPLPESFWTEPLVYQGGSDRLCGSREPIPFGGTDWGVDFEAELAVVTDDVPMSTGAADADAHIKLYMLANDVSLRRLIPAELATGFGFFSGKPATAFSPIAATPDELAAFTLDGRLDLPMNVELNGKAFGRARMGTDQIFTFSELICRASRTRALGAGTIVGGGTISNKLGDGPGLPVGDGGVGYSCIAEQRAVETIIHGQPRTGWLQSGDQIVIEVRTPDGASIFGKIEQSISRYPGKL